MDIIIDKRQKKSHNFDNLKQIILTKSEHREWIAARAEWTLEDFWTEDSNRTCVCGYGPILTCYRIQNMNSGVELVVGDPCIGQLVDREDLCCLFELHARLSKSYEKPPVQLPSMLTASIIVNAGLNGKDPKDIVVDGG